MAHALELGQCLLHERETDLGVRHFATAELQAELHLVAMIEELLGVADLGEEIAVGDTRGELDFLELGRGGLGVARLLLLFVNVFAEIHDAANGRLRGRGHLDEVEIELLREGQRALGLHDAELLAFGADDADFRFLDPRIAADVGKRVVVATLEITGAVAAGRRKRVGHQ